MNSGDLTGSPDKKIVIIKNKKTKPPLLAVWSFC